MVPPFLSLNAAFSPDGLHHVFRLWAFGTVAHLKLNLITRDQGLVAITGYCCVVDKDVLLAGLLDKPIALSAVEPFDLPCSFRHLPSEN
jgi:hypothetical protein